MAAPRTAARTTQTTNIIPAALSHDDLMALLGQTKVIASGGGEYHRLTLDSGVLKTDDGQEFFPQKPGTPSLTVRIVKPPVYYNAFYMKEGGPDGAIDAIRIGRPDLNGKFSRKYDDPTEQAADNNPANEVYDDLARVSGGRGSFKGDIQVQIAPENGEFTGEETVYTLSLSTTSVFEWRGSSKDQSGGSVSDFNFIVKLSQLAIAQAAEAGGDEDAQKRAVLDALTSLRLGGVVANVSILRASDKDNSRTWWVISFDPIHIEPVATLQQLPAGATEDVAF